MNLPKTIELIIKDLKSKTWVESLFDLGNVYIVGGAVRDAFLNKPFKDIDLVVEGTSLESISSSLSLFGKVSLVGESFSVIKFKPFGESEDIDIAIPREDRKIGNGHKGFEINTKGVDIISDLKRRDFTINSICINVKNNEIIDPFNGLIDILNKILRATDVNAFIEDPLRMMRCLQFSSRFNFNIEENTLKLMKSNAHLLKEIPGERILEEFNKVLSKGSNTKKVFEILYETNLDIALFDNKLKETYLKIKETDLLDNLNYLSFFYLLAKLGSKNPANFYKERLKGDEITEKDLNIIDNLINQFFNKNVKIDELRLLVFKSINKSIRVIEATKIFPIEINEILEIMKYNVIPKFVKDIQINGDDVIALGKKGKEIGNVLEQMYKDALYNKFNWKSREDCLNHLKTIKL